MLRNPISADALVQSVKTLAHCRTRMQQPARRPKSSRTLEERKLIDRAKGKLMDVFHLTESEAHYKIQKTSMDSGRRIADVAREIWNLPKTWPVKRLFPQIDRFFPRHCIGQTMRRGILAFCRLRRKERRVLPIFFVSG